jgi:hypothetical protein
MSKKVSKKTSLEKYWLIDLEGEFDFLPEGFDSLAKLESRFAEVLQDGVCDLNTPESFMSSFIIIKGTEIPFSITPTTICQTHYQRVIG